MTDEELHRRAAERGVVTGYHDAMGTWREPTVEVLRAVLDAMGAPVPPHERALMARPARPVASPDWARGGTVHCEDGRELPVPDGLPGGLPEGYHRLVHGERELPLVVAPDLAYMPAGLAGGERMWGVACQLYALRGRGSWGMGDMSDLAALPRTLGDPDFILVSPLHAPNPGPHPQPSPYFASSRIHRNPLHLALEAAPEMAVLTAHERARIGQLGEMGRALSHDELIHRDAVWALKREGLALLSAAALRTPHRAAALDRFRAEVPDVDDWARFCGLVEAHGADRGAWGDSRVADPVSDLHVYAQMLMDEQLAGLPRMRLGLMTDLAVGADRGGFDAWANPDVVASGLRLGCPPDLLGPEGQDWGIPPLLPDALWATGFRLFARIVRAGMAHAGGLRIDHVMGLSRLFVIPDGADALHGTYMRMPLDDLLGVVCLESVRAHCLVVGEDLGTVEDGFREHLAERGLLSYRLAWFEDRPAAEYTRQAMAAVTTHDLPTVAGFFTGADLQHLRDIGAHDPTVLDQMAGRQEGERHRLHERLDGEGIEGAWSDDPADLTWALNGLLARTPSMLACASLDDAVGAVMRPNVPGTIDQHPNWRVPLPETREDMAADPRVRRALAPLRDRPIRE